MKFTYEAYKNLIMTLKNKGYSITDYHGYREHKKCAILRHDVDSSLEKALRLAQCEWELKVNATYFLLLSTDFYNVASKRSVNLIKEIASLGHEIALHFDEEKYRGSTETIAELVVAEGRMLSDILNQPIKCVSMHRPSKETLQADYKFPGLVNSYGKEFFEVFKYVSDSRRLWREDVESYIQADSYMKMHILTHPLWYNEKEQSIEETVKHFVNSANQQRYFMLQDNIRDLNSIMRVDQIISNNIIEG